MVEDKLLILKTFLSPMRYGEANYYGHRRSTLGKKQDG